MAYSIWKGSEDGDALVDALTDQLAERIRELGLSQLEAAERLGMAQPNLSRLLRKKKEPGVAWPRLLPLLKDLGLDVEIEIRDSSRPQGHIRMKAPGA